MINQSLTDPNISEYPPPPLPPDSELRSVEVWVRYARQDEVNPAQNVTPYDGLTLAMSGDLVTVANWIDENLEAGQCALSGDPYVQGAALNGIKRALLKGGVHEFSNIAYFVRRTTP